MRKYIYIFSYAVWALSLSNVFSSVAQPTSFAQTQTPATSEPKFTPPPGTETLEIKKLIDQAQAALESGKTKPVSLLTNPVYMPAHEWPRFRKLIRQYAQDSQAIIVTPQEPGEQLVVSGTIRNQQGEPIKGAIVYLYQTSAKGWYSDKAPHISGMAGDEKHARLFGYLITGQDGQYELRTIRPAGYPNSNLPAHIHIEIEVGGARPHTFISEIQFEDDPRLTPEMRARSQREKLFIFPVTRDAQGIQRVKADFRI